MPINCNIVSGIVSRGGANLSPVSTIVAKDGKLAVYDPGSDGFWVYQKSDPRDTNKSVEEGSVAKLGVSDVAAWKWVGVDPEQQAKQALGQNGSLGTGGQQTRRVGFQQAGGQSGGQRLIATACMHMAQTAQELANRALKKSWSGYVDYDNALKMFDTDFTREYVGQDPPGGSYRGAISFYNNRNEAYKHRTVPPGYRGQTGFLSAFKEPLRTGQTDNDIDQTHHFATYMTFGINNQEAFAAIHALNDPEGQPDRDLGITAYGLGDLLRKDPTNLQKIGELVKKFCE